jgi:SAM-dependent methyltransferase
LQEVLLLKKILKVMMITKIIYWLIYKSKRLSGIAPIIIKFTGKNKEAIHPKHLIVIEEPWFIKELKKNDTVLDVGCGNGQNTLKAAAYCRKIYGVDFNKKQLGIGVREKKRKNIKNTIFVYHDIKGGLALNDKNFDVVMILDVLEHLEKQHRIIILKQIHKLLISVPNKETTWKKKLKKNGLPYYSDPDHKIEYDKNSIKKELIKLGFNPISLNVITYDHPLIGFIDIIGSFSLNLYAKINLWRKNKAIEQPNESTGFRIICNKI